MKLKLSSVTDSHCPVIYPTVSFPCHIGCLSRNKREMKRYQQLEP